MFTDDFPAVLGSDAGGFSRFPGIFCGHSGRFSRLPCGFIGFPLVFIGDAGLLCNALRKALRGKGISE